MSGNLNIRNGYGTCDTPDFPDNNCLITKNFVTSKFKNNFLIGEISFFGGTEPPTGWLFCDGRTLKRSEYPELSKVIGSSYGGNDLSFNLPDFRRKIPIGSNLDKNKPPLTIDYSGNSVVTGGNITINTTQLPNHTHNMSHSHKYSYNINGIADCGNCKIFTAATQTRTRIVSYYTSGDSYYSKETTDLSGNETGTQGSNNELLPPFCVVNYIIYTG